MNYLIEEDYKPRADKFYAIADEEALGVIQGELQRYKDWFPKAESFEEKDAHTLLFLYLQIAMDEGYRRAMEEMKKDVAGGGVKIVPRRDGWFEYIDDDKEAKSLTPLVKRRVKSKRQRAAQKKLWEGNGKKWSEEHFVLAMVIHTGWEHGYMKANTMEHVAKITCGGDKERADLILDMFNKVFAQYDYEEIMGHQGEQND